LDIKEIKRIVELMERSNLTEFEVEESDFKLRIARSNGHTVVAAAPAAPVAYAPPAGGTVPPLPVAPAEAPAPAKEETGKLIKSPMVGTFYTAPSPDSPPFVNVGDSVGPDSVVCIIEAMKVMNEIQAELSGTISELLVQNGESVEYGQPLFRVK